MPSPKSSPALVQLGDDVRRARLRRGFSAAELAVRAGTSPSTLTRLEKGDPGVAVGTLSDILVALGLVHRLADLLDVQKDELGLALSQGRLPKRGRSFATKLRSQAKGKSAGDGSEIDPDGVAF